MNISYISVNKLLITILLVIISSSLIACSQQYKAERHMAKYGIYCETLGFVKSSEAWMVCVQNRSALVNSIFFRK